MDKFFKSKLAIFARITEKDYQINCDELLMTITESVSGKLVVSGSKAHCEHYIDAVLLKYMVDNDEEEGNKNERNKA
jgi:hypothetical protein